MQDLADRVDMGTATLGALIVQRQQTDQALKLVHALIQLIRLSTVSAVVHSAALLVGRNRTQMLFEMFEGKKIRHEVWPVSFTDPQLGRDAGQVVSARSACATRTRP